MRTAFARILGVLALGAGLLGVASPVAAAPAANGPECAEQVGPSSGFYEPDESLLPPAFRDIPYSCATRSTELELEDFAGYYRLLYLDPSFDEYLDMVRALEREGWVQSTGWGNVYYADGSTGVSYETTPDELAALEEVPDLVQHWFITEEVDGDIQMAWEGGGAFLAEDGPRISVAVSLAFRYSTTGLDDPSTLSGLDTIADKLPDATQTAVIAAGSVMLMLVVGWPSTLLNSVVGSRYAQFVRWADARSKGRKQGDDAADESAVGAPQPRRLPGWLMWPGFALAALIGAFTDPDFGWNWMSLRLVVTLFLSFLLFNLLVWLLVKRIALRLQPASQPYLRFRWGSLLLVVLAVLLSRLLDFEPGVIFGLVAGIAYAVALQASGSAIIVLVGSGISLALALVAWVGYSGLAPVAELAGDNLPLVFATEFLAGVTVKGVSSLPLSLLPLGTLDGAKLVKWKRWAWAIAYAVGLAAFMLVLLTIPKAWGEIPGDFVRWLVIFLAYGVFAVGAWALNSWLLARAAKRAGPAAEPVAEEPEATTID